MKKVLSIITVISILIVGLFCLTGCGKKEESGKEAAKNDEEVIIATKTEEESGVQMTMKVEVTFKNDIATKAVTSMEFDSEETASSMYQFLGSSDGATLSGKTIKMKEETPDEEDKDIKKQDFIDQMTTQGFTIQK